MKTWKAVCTGLVTLAGLSPHGAWAQVPAVPVGPAVPVAPVVPGAPPPSGLLQFLGLTKEQKEAMKRKCCKTPFGQMINNMLKPVALFSGGMFGNFCPQDPTLADQAKPGPEGAAAKVQADEAAVKAKREAIRYLGTVDCHYWPEVADALIAALRAERNECVRWEAAMALGGGCCCTKKTIEALLISATGSEKDGNPGETCPRVREAAMASLQHCLSCFSEEVPVEPKKPERPESVTPPKPEVTSLPDVRPIAYYQHLDAKPFAQTVREGRLAVAKANEASPELAMPTGTRSMSMIFANATVERPFQRRGRSEGYEVVETSYPTAAEPTAVATAAPMPAPSAGMVMAPPAPVSATTFVPTPAPVAPAPQAAAATPPAEEKPHDLISLLRSRRSLRHERALESTPQVVVEPVQAATPVQSVPVHVQPVPVPTAVQPAVAPAPAPPQPAQPTVRPAEFRPADTKPQAVQPTSLKTTEAAPAAHPSQHTATPYGNATVPQYGHPPALASVPQTPARPVMNGPNPDQLLLVLRNDVYPFRREWAGDNLANVDLRSHPEVLEALLAAAQKDAAATVRVTCIRSLVKLNANTAVVLAALQRLRTDSDPRVSREADVALGKLSAGRAAAPAPTHTYGAVQPVSYQTTYPAARQDGVRPAAALRYQATDNAFME